MARKAKPRSGEFTSEDLAASFARFFERASPEQRAEYLAAVHAASKEVARWRENMRRSAVYAAERVKEMLEGIAGLADVVRYALEREAVRDDGYNAELARMALEDEREESTPHDSLARKLHRHFGKLAAAVGLARDDTPPATEEDAMRPAAVDGDPLLWADEILAQYVEGLAPDPKAAGLEAIAGRVRMDARRRWAELNQTTTDGSPENGRIWWGWMDLAAERQGKAYPALLCLAFAVWRAELLPELEAKRERAIRKTPAVNLELFDRHLEPVLTSRPTVERDPHGTGAVVWVEEKRGERAQRKRIGTLPSLDAGDVDSLAVAERGLVKLLRSPPGLRLIYFAVAAAVERLAVPLADRDDNAPYIVVPFPGGLRAFARSLGCDVTRLSEILDAGREYQTTRLRGLWTWDVGDPGKSAQACLTWNMGVFNGAGGRGLRVPLPDYARRLPDVGSRVAGPAAVAWLLTHRKMTEHSIDLCREPQAAPLDWREIAGRAGLSKGTADRLLGKLIEGDDDGPFLLQPERGFYRLADDRAHRYLVQQGALRLDSSDAGRLGAEKRQRQREQAARKQRRKGTKTN